MKKHAIKVYAGGPESMVPDAEGVLKPLMNILDEPVPNGALYAHVVFEEQLVAEFGEEFDPSVRAFEAEGYTIHEDTKETKELLAAATKLLKDWSERGATP